jgi:hypothetical protein
MNADSHNGLAGGAEILRCACLSVFISVYLWTTESETAFSHHRMRPLVVFCFRGVDDTSSANYSLGIWNTTMVVGVVSG